MSPSNTVSLELNPYPLFGEMRRSKPVHFNEMSNMWEVFRYNDVQRVLSEYATFSSSFIGGGGPFGESLVSTDPPKHRQLRNIVTQAFTPRTVAQLAPRITAIVHDLLNQVMAQGEMDVVNDLAGPLPTIVTAELLGIPKADRERFRRWPNAIVSTSADGIDPQTEMGAYFRQMIELRRQEPRDDLISALIAAQIDGEYLNTMELLGFCFLLLVAGNETTTNLIGNTLICLDEHPEAKEQLAAEPSLVPAAIEEVLRYLAPVQCMFRVTTTDTVVSGQEIPAHKGLMTWIAAANRDEAQFSEPERFDIRRTPNRHIAFGHGIHFCLGAPLARLEGKIALEVMLERLPNINRVRSVPLQRRDSFFLYGVKHLPITFGRSLPAEK
ncbi:MAG: monooxygenase YjiB [Ktedonobacteraceae bacterium]